MSLESNSLFQSNIVSVMETDDYDALPVEWPMSVHMSAGAAAGVMEHAAMYPIDCVKTQMQSIKSVHYNGIKDAFITILHKEGVKRLLRGMNAMVIGAGPAHAMYFSCYEKVKRNLTLRINGRKWKNSTIANGTAGATATFFHDVVMNPADVIKQRMQMYGSTYSSCFHCLQNTYKNEGLKAFYRSFPTQLMMNVPFQTVHFVIYELTQEQFNSSRVYSPLSHMISGAMAGGTAAFVTNPLDVCRTLLNTQQHNRNNAIRGLWDALVVVYQVDGWRTFFRGVTARVLYQMPSTAISWSVYEFFKYFLYGQNYSSKHFEACASPSCPGTVLPNRSTNE